MSAIQEIEPRPLGLEQQLREVSVNGAAYFPGFVDDDTIAKFQWLFRRLEFNRVNKKFKNVSEEYLVPRIVPRMVDEEVEKLGEDIRERLAVYSTQFPILGKWKPNEHSIQLYDKVSYITSHRDQSSFKGLVAVVSVQGEADFEVSSERGGHPYAITWKLEPGDMTVLRAKGLNPILEGQPGIFHSVSGSIGDLPRISIGFRQI